MHIRFISINSLNYMDEFSSSPLATSSCSPTISSMYLLCRDIMLNFFNLATYGIVIQCLANSFVFSNAIHTKYHEYMFY